MDRYKDFKKAGLSREQTSFYISRKRMVEEQLLARGVRDERVIKVMSEIPRHLFVPKVLYGQAYSDYPLNIGEGQTISQPFMVAIMTVALELKGCERVLEIGTGSGYQTAILAELSKHVYTIERLRALANRARRLLYDIGVANFSLKVGDGTLGWPEEAPFDGIIVTAGSPGIPKVYIEQLAEGGRLVIPVGDEWSQQLVVARKVGRGVEQKNVTGCRFVKLVGRYGWSSE